MLGKLVSAVGTAIGAIVFDAAIASFVLANSVLAPGDRLAFKVIGSNDFDTTSTIDSDGMVNLPVIGLTAASGLTIDQLRQEVADALKQVPIQMQGADSLANWKKVEPSNVFITVVEYRPIYVTGDVSNGVAHAFRPGMTARQALVVAGGIAPSIGQVGTNELAKILAERSLLDNRLALARSEVARVRATLAAIGPDRLLDFSETRPLAGKKMPLAGEQWITTRAELRALRAESNALALQQMQERLSVLEQLENVSRANSSS